jgi:hypothetical protein
VHNESAIVLPFAMTRTRFGLGSNEIWCSGFMSELGISAKDEDVPRDGPHLGADALLR